MNARKLTNIINSYSMMTPEAAKKIKFVFIRSIDLDTGTEMGCAPCDVFTLEYLRESNPFLATDQAIWFEKNINRELSVIYEDLSILENEKPKE
jgi:hypothetical protein